MKLAPGGERVLYEPFYRYLGSWGRRWSVLPPPLGAEADFEHELLSHPDEQTAFACWCAYRAAAARVGVQNENEEPLFDPEALERRAASFVAPAEIMPQLQRIMLLAAEPEAVPQISGPALEVANWALNSGYRSGLLAFCSLASAAQPGSAGISVAVGRLLRTGGYSQEAIAWFDWAVAVGRRNQDWESYGWALLGRGKAEMARGRLPQARGSFERASRVGVRRSLPLVVTSAVHNLMAWSVEAGAHEEYAQYLREAMRHYDSGHPRLPAFAHDVAYQWVQLGALSEARHLLAGLSSEFFAPPEQLLLLSTRARLAGALGDKRQFDQAFQRADQLVRSLAPRHRVGAVWLEFARGAVALGAYDQAAGLLDRANADAVLLQEHRVPFDVDQLRLELERRRSEATPAEVRTAIDEASVEVVRLLDYAAVG
jgi:tetratricopeptide (TPR) repeat protein